MPPEPTAKFAALRNIIADMGDVLVTFSGGVDSTFLLKVATDVLGERCHAVTCVSETMARSEIRDAEALGAELGLGARHHIIASQELSQPGFSDNPEHRCALCKTELLDIAGPLASRLGIGNILLGTNTNDLGDYRPGIAAAKDRGAHAPMVDAGLSKDDIRALSRQLGLRTWDKPQLACLSSRFPYGTTITKERLERVDRFEEGLRALEFSQVRVRFHDTIARVEVPATELDQALVHRTSIVDLGRQCGFAYTVLDLAGFRSGSLNETLVPLRRKAG